MKYLYLTSLLIISALAFGQKSYTLKEYDNGDAIPEGKTLIYGNFVQRLGFSSGGFPQAVVIADYNSKKLFSLKVKSTFASSKQNIFMYFIQPGTYIIVAYQWTQSKWYGGESHMEYIFKDIDMEKMTDKKFEEIKATQKIERFTFTVKPDVINYLGTWHFDTGQVYFTDDKVDFDSKIQQRYNKLSLNEAVANLPN